MHFKNGFIAIGISLFVLVVASLFMSHNIVRLEHKVSEAEQEKLNLYLLADTLRQSSDDLTKMARMYAVTGNETYKNYFNQILDIRNGLSPRPEEYHKIYWDIVISESGREPRKSQKAISFMDMVRESGVSDVELKLLKSSQQQSNNLAKLEEKAMNAMVGLYEDQNGDYTIKAEPNKNLAMSILHGDNYNKAKSDIMAPLLQFLEAVDGRIHQKETNYTQKQSRLGVLFYLSMALSVILILALIILTFNYIRLDKQIANRPKLSKVGIWKTWPFAMATLTAIFATLMISWWFIGEIRVKTHNDLESRLRLDLQSANDSIISWIDFMSLEASFIAKHMSHDLGHHGRLAGENHEELKSIIEDRLDLFDTSSFSDFILLTSSGEVISSNIETMQGVPDFYSEIENQINQPPHNVIYLNDNLPDSQNADSKGSVEFIFGDRVELPNGNLYLLMIVPNTEINLILQRSFFGFSGELYLVNSKGKLITESRFLEDLIKQKTIPEGKSSSVGLRLGSNPKDSNSPLIKSVANIVEGKPNEEIMNPYINYMNQSVLGVWRWNNVHNFGLVSEINSNEALETFHTYRTKTIYFSVITVVLILMLFSIFIVNRVKADAANLELSRTYETIKKQQERVARDMVTGQQVQMNMLPDSIDSESFLVDAILKPAQMVAGDFYDFSFAGLNKNKFYFSIGDVSGKGIPAALFMSATKALINKTVDQTYSSKEIVEKVNKELASNNTRCMFVTLILGVVDIKTHECEMTNAGHIPLYIKRSSGNLEVWDKTDGPLLGIVNDATYTSQKIKLGYGDKIVCYTDGITEAQNNQKEFYGESRLEELLRKKSFENPKEVIEQVADSVTNFIDGAAQFDDITVLSFKYIGQET